MLLKITALTAFIGLAMTPHELPDLNLGDKAPAIDVKMKDVSGKEVDLQGAAGKNGLLVIFSCNTCPFVVGSDGSQGWEGRYPGIGDQAAKSGIGFAMVNSNTLKRAEGDGLADMQARYKDKKFNGLYLLDENNKVADAFGARTTPHVFLFDKDMKLVYKGAIDDNVEDPKAVKQHYLSDAIKALSAGKPIAPAMTRNIGCSIKRAHAH
jgi:hypothetical protein